MVVLNICKRIAPVCISKKLGLYISNLSDCPFEGWDKSIVDEFIKAYKIAMITTEEWEIDFEAQAYDHYKKHFPSMLQEHSCFNQELIQEIVSNLVCIYLNYEYEDMPMGGWEENPFDGRCCEKDYAEMIVEFFNFISEDNQCPYWIYSSNYDEPTPFHKLLWVDSDSESKIECLRLLGKKIDTFLEDRNDYLAFDYLVKSVYDEHGYGG